MCTCTTTAAAEAAIRLAAMRRSRQRLEPRPTDVRPYMNHSAAHCFAESSARHEGGRGRWRPRCAGPLRHPVSSSSPSARRACIGTTSRRYRQRYGNNHNNHNNHNNNNDYNGVNRFWGGKKKHRNRSPPDARRILFQFENLFFTNAAPSRVGYNNSDSNCALSFWAR